MSQVNLKMSDLSKFLGRKFGELADVNISVAKDDAIKLEAFARSLIPQFINASRLYAQGDPFAKNALDQLEAMIPAKGVELGYAAMSVNRAKVREIITDTVEFLSMVFKAVVL
jgi:hypothetical protein